jgi:hypothetical protein
MDRGDSVRLCTDFAPHLLRAEIDKLCRLGSVLAIAEERLPSLSQSVVSTLFGVPKRCLDEIRPVINLKTINPYVKYTHFKMEGLRTVKELLLSEDWMVTVDLKDAFHHVPIHQDQQRFFRFRFEGQLYQWQAMPFGYSDAPRVFTKLMKVIAEVARTRGLRMVIYLDDILLMSRTRKQAILDRNSLLEILSEFGLSVNTRKSELDPAQIRKYLGVLVDSVRMVLSLPPAKLTAITRQCKAILHRAQKGQRIGLKTLQKVVGTLQSVNDCVLPTRMHLNALTEALRAAHHSDRGSGCAESP